MESIGLTVFTMVAFVAAIVVFYLIGHKLGWQEGYRKASKEFEGLLDEMRQDTKEVDEEVRKLKKQIGDIEKIGRNLDDGK